LILQSDAAKNTSVFLPKRMLFHAKKICMPAIQLRSVKGLLDAERFITWRGAGHGEHSEDAWIWMVKCHGIHGAELAKVILVWDVVAVPGHHIEGGERL